MEVDLCFVMDCTGSMAGHIDAAKECILKVVDYMEKMKKITIRVGFCGYRDHCDNANRLQVFDFTDCGTFKNNLSNVPAMGGGDSPEDVLGGLNAAITQMTWRNSTRVLLHVGDCPPHGRRFTNLSDDYPGGDPNGLTAEAVLDNLKTQDIYYFFGKITNLTDEMIRVFRSIIGEFTVFDLSANTEELVKKFFEATCNAINAAISLRSP